MSAFAAAETHTIVVDDTGFTPDSIVVAPGDSILFDAPCGTRVRTGNPCASDGMLDILNPPPTCPGMSPWQVPQFASAVLPVYTEGYNFECDGIHTAEIIVVGDGAVHLVPGDYATIGEAVAAAESGDTIEIAAGTYAEHDIAIEFKTLTLRGEANPDGTPGVTIDAQQQGRVLELVGGGDEPGEPGLILIDNIVLTGGSIDGDGGGVSITNCSPILRNCTITGNTCTGNGGGAHVARAAESAPWITAQPRFARSTVSLNHAADGGGIYSVGDQENGGCLTRVTGCLITENTADDGIAGIYHLGGGDTSVTYSIICGNYPGQLDGQISMSSYNSCALTNCLDDDDDGVPDGCASGDADGILHVPTEYPTLRLAWEEVEDGNTIMIAAGEYGTDGANEFRAEDMTISIIGETNDDGTPAVIIDGENDSVQLYMAILGDGTGYATVENIHFKRFGGGLGMGNCSGEIRNCIIEDGYANVTGLYLLNFQGTVESCRISDNNSNFFAAGILIQDDPNNAPSNISLIDCVVENNYAAFVWGGGWGGVTCGDGNGTVDLTGCTITANSGADGGGLRAYAPWVTSLTDTAVCGNEIPEQILGDWVDNGGNCVQVFCDDCDAACPGDYDGNGTVNVSDLLTVIGSWNDPYDVGDLLLVISEWNTTCP